VGTFCETLPIYGCTYGDAVNFDAAGTVDDGTCVAQAAPSTLPTVGGLTVATVTLPAPIAGSLQEWSEHCSTPQRVVVTADKTNPDRVFMGWTEDLAWGVPLGGRVHITSLSVCQMHDGNRTIERDRSFDGFVRNGGMDISPEGHVGMMAAKVMIDWTKAGPWFRKGFECPTNNQAKEEGGSCPSYEEYDPWAWQWYRASPMALGNDPSNSKNFANPTNYTHPTRPTNPTHPTDPTNPTKILPALLTLQTLLAILSS
jgi:hypothetical protein